MIPTVKEIEEIIKITKNVNIDIKKTISSTISAGWMGEDYYVLGSHNEFLPDEFIDEGLEYELLSDSYYDYVYKMLDDGGIYIALAYVADFGISNDSKIFKHNIEGLGEKEISYGGITTWRDEVGLELPEESVATAAIDEYSDFGIIVVRKEKKFEITYAYNEYKNYGPGGSQSIHEIETELANPVYRLVIKLMSEAIVLKDE